VFFLSLAIIINLRNWAYFNIRIGEMVYHSQVLDQSTNIDQKVVRMNTNAHKNSKILNIVIIGALIVIGCLLGVFIYFAINIFTDGKLDI